MESLRQGFICLCFVEKSVLPEHSIRGRETKSREKTGQNKISGKAELSCHSQVAAGI